MPAPLPEFRPAWWLPFAHLQTTWGRLARSKRRVAFRRERLETPDGDELLLDHAHGPDRAAPRLLLLHGLEGSSSSVYMQGLAALALGRGWSVTALNFRSCALDPADGTRLMNRRPRLYHSGETTDLDLVVTTLAAREPGGILLAAGVSLGGNVLLKWLGEHPGDRRLRAAATLSVPYDLAAGSRCLETPAGRLYVEVFLRTLRKKALHLVERFPEAARRIDVERLLLAQSFFDLDDAATGPLHGFSGADDYYARSSSIRFVPHITIPVLCLSAADDPFLPPEVLPRVRAAASQAVELVVTPRGGHAGWLAGAWPGSPSYWAEEGAVEWLGRFASA